MIDMKINGGKELHDLLQQLPVQVETKLLRAALGRGVKVIQAEAKLRVPDETGQLRRAIKTTRDTRQGRVIAKVKLKGKHAYLGVFQEYGVAAHAITVKEGSKKTALRIGDNFVGAAVMHPGHAAQPFLRPAFDTKAAEAIDVIGQFIGQYLQFGAIQAPTIAVDEEGE